MAFSRVREGTQTEGSSSTRLWPKADFQSSKKSWPRRTTDSKRTSAKSSRKSSIQGLTGSSKKSSTNIHRKWFLTRLVIYSKWSRSLRILKGGTKGWKTRSRRRPSRLRRCKKRSIKAIRLNGISRPRSMIRVKTLLGKLTSVTRLTLNWSSSAVKTTNSNPESSGSKRTWRQITLR